MKSGSVAAAACLLLCGANGMYSKQSPVLQVDGRSYENLIARSNHTSIVEFYAPWCGHYKNLQPAYEKAAKSLTGLAKVAAIDCDEEANKPFCGSMGVKGFPTLKIVRPGKKPGRPVIEDYNGGRTAKAIVDAVVDKIPNHVKRLKNADFEDWAAEGEAPKAVLFSDKGTVSALLKSVAIDFLGALSVGQVRDKETELQNLENDAGVFKAPMVETVPDDGQPPPTFSTSQDDAMAPPPVSTATSRQEPSNVSPIERAQTGSSRAPSIGGGYFPEVPDATSSSAPAPSLPSTPADFYNKMQPPPVVPPPQEFGLQPEGRPSAPTPHQMSAPTATPPALRAPVVPLGGNGPPVGGYNADDDAIMAAQKHAKWAISALNFEDVETGVKELRAALHSLGAS